MLRLLLSVICQWLYYRAQRFCSAHVMSAWRGCIMHRFLHRDAVTPFPSPSYPPLLSPAAIWTLRQRSPRLCYAYLATLRPAELVRSAHLFVAYARTRGLCHTTPQALLATWQRRIAAYRTEDSLL